MEPNTSSSPTAWTSPAAVIEHGEPSVRDPSLLSPAFSHAPSPGLVPASRSRSGSSWYQQIPPSPATAAGDGSLSVHAHATSLQSLPLSFPIAGTLPMVGYDLFSNPEATVATPLPTLLGGQWEQGESSLRAAPVLLECLSPGLFGFTCESAAWASEEMSSSFLSSSSAGGLALQSSDNLVEFAQPSSDSELEALLQSLCIPLLAVEESPVDAPLSPIEEEGDIDVSVFLVSDLEDRLPNASWTASLQMAGSGGKASASWMAPGSTGNNWPLMLAPAVATTCTMVTTSSGSMACHSVGSSIGVASSIGGMMKPTSPVLPLVLPSSQGVGASSSNFSSFMQPSSSPVLAPLVPNLHGPLLPVKQEVMESGFCMEYVDAAACRHPANFISLVVDDEEDWYNVFSSGGSSSPASFAPRSWLGSSSGYPSFAPGNWGSGSSSSPSFAPDSWGSSNGSPSFAPNSWGGSSNGSPSFAPSSWGGSSSCCLSFAPGRWGSSSPSFAPGRWGSSSSPSFAWSTPCYDRSTSIDIYGSGSMTKLSIGGKMSSTSGLPPLPRAGASSRKANGGAGIVFTDPEKAIIAKDKKLQELLRTDPKKVKRILYNRAYSETAKVRKVMHTKNLERLVVTLEERHKSLCAELQSLEEGSAALMAQKMEMQMIIGELEQQTMLKDAVREGLRAEIQNLKHLELN